MVGKLSSTGKLRRVALVILYFERVVIPEKYRNVIAKMADYKAGNLPEGWSGEETVTIGKGEYPNVIKEEL